MFYGNYDSKTQASTMPSSGDDDFGALKDDTKQIIVRPLFHAFTEEDGVPSFVLVTYALPEDKEFDCHACAPAIGMAVFSRKGADWTMTASNEAVTEAGAWGKPERHIQLVRIGPRHHGVAITNHDSHFGESSSALLILVPWDESVTLAITRAIAGDDAGNCGKDSDPPWPCYSYKRIFTFLRDGDAEFYRLRLTLTGTDFVDCSSGSDRDSPITKRQVRGLEILRLKDGKYVQVLRRGDLTNVDRDLADTSQLN